MEPSSIVGAAGSIAVPVSSSNSRRATAIEVGSAAVGLALRDRPVAKVALGEIGPARVREQDLEWAVGVAAPPVEQDPGARPFSHRVDGRARPVDRGGPQPD